MRLAIPVVKAARPVRLWNSLEYTGGTNLFKDVEKNAASPNTEVMKQSIQDAKPKKRVEM